MVKGYDPSKNDPSKLVLEYLMRWTLSQNPLSLQQAEKYTKYWLKYSQSTSNIYQLFKIINHNVNSNNKNNKNNKNNNATKQIDNNNNKNVTKQIDNNNNNNNNNNKNVNQNNNNQLPYILPQIILKKSCSNILKNFSFSLLLKQNNLIDENFPAYSQDNKIYVCLNYITNKTELKENIDRQLMILYKKYQQQYNNKLKYQQQYNNKLKYQQQYNYNTTLKVKYNNDQRKSNGIENKNKINQTNKQDTYIQQLQQKDKQLCSYIYQGCKQGYKNYMLQPQIQQRLTRKCTKYLFFRRTPRNLPYDVKFRYASKIIQEVL